MHRKGNHKQSEKRTFTEWENIFVKEKSNKRLISKIQNIQTPRVAQKTTNQKTTHNPIKK